MAAPFPSSSALSSQELDRLYGAVSRNYFFPTSAGGAVTFSATRTFNISAVAANCVIVNGTTDTTGQSSGSVTLDVGDSNPRRDHIYYQPGTGFGVVKGTAVASTSTTGPVLPSLSANQISLAEVAVAANATTLSGGNITDRRLGSSVSADPQSMFRASRRRYAEISYPANTVDIADNIVILSGFGASIHTGSGAFPTHTNNIASGTTDAYTAITSNGAVSTGYGSNVLFSTTTGAIVRPDKNPLMLIRWFPGTSNANLTTTVAGFVATGTTINSTMNGAYLRANTTGNLFFVTRQGASETTTDLGARPTTLTSYEIYTADAGVTWICRNDTTGATVATHTTNVPTATTQLAYIFGGTSGSGSLNVANIAYFYVEAGTSAA